MAGLVRQEERAAARELALRRRGVELVAAGGREQVNEAAISAVLALVGRPATVRLVLLDGDARRRCRLVRRRGRMAGIEVGVRLAARVRQGDPAGLARASCPRNRRRSFAFIDGRAVLVLPLSVRDEARGLLVLCSPVDIPRELVDSLESLASQVSLAVEGASLAEDLHRRQSEARFRSLVAHSSDLITVLDAHGTVTYQSPSIERVLGYRADEIEGTRLRAAAQRSPIGRGSRRSCLASARPTSAAARRHT